MFLPYIFAFIIHCVLAAPPCEHGVELVSTETKNPEDLLGNWTYVYNWDPDIKSIVEFHEPPPSYECPQLHFEAITPELVKAKEAECAKYKIPFNWADAKLKVDAPLLNLKGGVITFGEKENWLAVDCTSIKTDRVLLKMVSDDYIAMVYLDKNSESVETVILLVREPPTLDELECFAHNLDVGKGMLGYEICFK